MPAGDVGRPEFLFVRPPTSVLHTTRERCTVRQGILQPPAWRGITEADVGMKGRGEGGFKRA